MTLNKKDFLYIKNHKNIGNYIFFDISIILTNIILFLIIYFLVNSRIFNTNLIVGLMLVLPVTLITFYGFYIQFQQYQRIKPIYHIIHNNLFIFNFIFENQEKLPKVSIEKIKSYDFAYNLHLIKLLIVKKDYQQMIDKIDIWETIEPYKILYFNNKKYIVPDDENIEQIQFLLKAINDVKYEYTHIKFPEFISSNKNYLYVKDLTFYYEKMVNMVYV